MFNIAALTLLKQAPYLTLPCLFTLMHYSHSSMERPNPANLAMGMRPPVNPHRRQHHDATLSITP